jgi:1,4-alpha-glucan branching enzyme
MAESGFNVLELMPIQEFPGDLSWGYNPAFLFAPESAYGAPEDLKYLVNKCHKAGIAVWVDVVLNHMDEPSLPGNLGWFNGDDIYFYSGGSGYQDTGVGPRPDYGRVEVRDYLVDAIRHLIEEHHIDGFRFDHTAWIKVNADGWKPELPQPSD